MITRDQLIAAPSDPTKLQELEDEFSGRADALINSLDLKNGLAIKRIEFKCTLGGTVLGVGGLAAEAKVTDTNCYQILIGRNFSNSIHNFSIWSSERLFDKLPITKDIHEFRSFLYEYWMWLTFHHEFAHITSGHLDFLLKHGLIHYAEIFGVGKEPEEISVPGVEARDVWWAIESEADSIGTATSLATLYLTKHRSLWVNQTPQQTISMHGLLTSLYFFMFEALSSGKDQRHPAPAFRKAVCQPSLDNLCKQMNLNSEQATNLMVISDFDMISSVLEHEIDVRPYFEAFNWMLGLDDLIRKMKLSEFRKK